MNTPNEEIESLELKLERVEAELDRVNRAAAEMREALRMAAVYVETEGTADEIAQLHKALASYAP